MSNFVHLHVHSHYSLLDGLCKIPDLVKTAKKRGFSTLALTDLNNMYGAIEFYETCVKEGVKPIIGMEIGVSGEGDWGDRIQNQRRFHLVLLALDYVGYKNLLMLASLAHLRGLYGGLGVDSVTLRAHSAGLAALSAGQDGEIAGILRQDDNYERAKSAVSAYREIFGPGNFYLELMDLPAETGRLELNTKLIQLSKNSGAPLVITRDVHYLNPDDDMAQDILTCIRDGRTVDEVDRKSLVGIDMSLAGGEEIIKRFRHVPEAIINTVKIAERVNLNLRLNKWHFANIEVPAGKTMDEYLREEVYRRLPALLEVTKTVQERVEYELEVIIKKGYSPYFLVVADYVNYARTHGIVETTRGSGAGSIVAFAMGITTINPLYFKLPFERFLNPFRPSPPDIDVDFADDRRDEVIDYVTRKYGADKVAQIITFGTMAARGSVRDVGRALGYSYTFCDQVAKLIPFGAQGFEMTISKALNLTPELKDLYDKNPQVKRLLDLAQKIEGCARHTSMHAAGVVIAPTPLTDYTPIQKETGGERITTQYEMHAVEAAGILKMDFLGIRNLSILGHAVEIVERTAGRRVDIYNLFPWDDKVTYDMLASGETVGVFQLSGSGMTRYLKELRPSSIFDIMAMVALFRPGPMESIPEYIRRRHHADMIDYLDQRMKKYLDQSLGLMVYQDDVLLTAINLAGYNWEEVDKFRKAMGKKIPAEMEKQKERFFNGCREHGKLSEAKINRLWELIAPFAAYGFNKAHAASYAVVAYQTAYMKAHFPIQYMTAVLIAESGDIEKVPEVIRECERMGIKVLPPDINESSNDFVIVNPPDGSASAYIRFGLCAIKNLGEHIAEVISRERENRGAFQTLQDFLERVRDKDLNKKSLESLIKCGALDAFGFDRGRLVANIENLLSFARHSQGEDGASQHSLFSGTGLDSARQLRLEEGSPATAEAKLSWEKELLGIYVTAHPFAYYERALSGVLTPIKDLADMPRNKSVVVGGVIDNTKKKVTRAGAPMMFVTIQDTAGRLELLVFPRVYATTKDVWAEGRAVAVVGRTSGEDGDDKLFVEKAFVLTKDNARQLAAQLTGGVYTPRGEYGPPSAESGKKVEIFVKQDMFKKNADGIKILLVKYPGEVNVFIVIGDKKIKTSYRVELNTKFIQELEDLVGKGNVKF